MAFEDRRVEDDWLSTFEATIPLELRVCKVYKRYCSRYSSAIFGISYRTINRYKPLVRELYDFFSEQLWTHRYISQIQKEIKFSRHYKRRDIARIFSEIGGLTITRYTNEYGKTIVYFKDASNSPR